MAPLLHVFLSLLLATAVVAKPPAGVAIELEAAAAAAADGLNATSTCNGRPGKCNEDKDMATESSVSRRILRNDKVKHISYEALKKNRVPCGQRGASYYNCHGHTQVNPYRRACTAITQCARILD